MHSLMILSFQAVAIRSLRAEPCQTVPSGVLCTSEGFRILTERIISQNAERQTLQLRLSDAMHDLDDMNTMYTGCEARLTAIPPPPPPANPMWPMIGVGAAVLGGVLLTASVTGAVPDTLEFPSFMIGLALSLGGAGLAWPH